MLPTTSGRSPCGRLLAISVMLMLLQLNVVVSEYQHQHDVNDTNSNANNTFDYFVKTYLSRGSMNNAYLTYDEYIDFLNMVEYTFPNTTTLDSIGYSFNNNSIPLLTISNKTHQHLPKKSILITGMIHGREPVSMMMNLYIILHILTLPQSLLQTLLYETHLYFIPIINVDAYIINCEQYALSQSVANSYYRKNRHFDTDNPCKADINNGVDLNRNFKVGFGYDNIGSSNDVCDEAYRGESAFSEPETQAFRDFVLKHNDIVISINYHTWGNLIITPYNYLSHEESMQFMQRDKGNQLLWQYYQEFEREAGYPEGFLFGNGMKTIKYTANGDCTDWMFEERKVLSFSPELGNGKIESDVFYPKKNVTFDIIEKNLPSALYAIQKTKYYLTMEQLGSYYIKCDEYYATNKYKEMNHESNLRGKHNDVFNCDSNADEVLHFEIVVINKGFSDYVYNVYNEVYLQLTVAITQVKSVIYWFTNENKQAQHYQGINSGDGLSSEDSDFAQMKMPIDIDVPSRSNVTLIIEVICDRNAFYKQYQNKEHTLDAFHYIHSSNGIDEPILTIYNNNNQISTTIPRFDSDEYNTFKWKFNSPYITFYYTNITEYSWLIASSKTELKTLLTPTSLVLCGGILLFIFLLLYVIYIVFKDNKTHHQILHEERESISATTKAVSSSITASQDGNQHIQMYMELPNIPSNKDQVIS